MVKRLFGEKYKLFKIYLLFYSTLAPDLLGKKRNTSAFFISMLFLSQNCHENAEMSIFYLFFILFYFIFS